MGDRLALTFGGDRLVLVTDQDVTAALDEHIGGLAPRRGPQFDVLAHQLVDEVKARMGIVAIAALDGVRGKQIPLRRA